MNYHKQLQDFDHKIPHSLFYRKSLLNAFSVNCDTKPVLVVSLKMNVQVEIENDLKRDSK